MRILFITDRYPPDSGGASKSADRISKSFSESVHIIHILHLSTDLNPGEIVSEDISENRIVHKIGLFPEFDISLQWTELIINGLHRRVNFDVFHGHGIFPAGFLAAYCGNLHDIKTITSIRGNDLDRGIYRSDIFNHLIWTLQNIDIISAVSSEAITKVHALTARKSGIFFTPNGVNTDIFKPEKKNKKLLNELNIKDETILLFTGEMRFKKGLPFIYDAFQKINKKTPCKLILAGIIRDKVETENFILKYPSLRNQIIFLPYICSEIELGKIYNLCDLFLSPSLWDGMPNSVLEAMACGKIVIGTNTGGMPDIITHGINGILINPNELQRLDEACIEIITLPVKSIKLLEKNARKTVEQSFKLSDELAIWNKVYTEVYSNKQ